MILQVESCDSNVPVDVFKRFCCSALMQRTNFVFQVTFSLSLSLLCYEHGWLKSSQKLNPNISTDLLMFRREQWSHHQWLYRSWWQPPSDQRRSRLSPHLIPGRTWWILTWLHQAEGPTTGADLHDDSREPWRGQRVGFPPTKHHRNHPGENIRGVVPHGKAGF